MMFLSSDDSENDFDDPQLVLTRYKKAGYQAALSCPHNYYRACQELIELFSSVAVLAAVRVKKPLLAELSADTRLAIDCCDGYIPHPYPVSSLLFLQQIINGRVNAPVQGAAQRNDLQKSCE